MGTTQPSTRSLPAEAACESARSCRAGSATRPRGREAETQSPACDSPRAKAATSPAAPSGSTRPTAVEYACRRRSRGAPAPAPTARSPRRSRVRGRPCEAFQLVIDQTRHDRWNERAMRVVPHAHRPAFPQEHRGWRVQHHELHQEQQKPQGSPRRSTGSFLNHGGISGVRGRYPGGGRTHDGGRRHRISHRSS